MKTNEQLDREVAHLRGVLGTLIIWLNLELGSDNVKTLLEDLHRETESESGA